MVSNLALCYVELSQVCSNSCFQHRCNWRNKINKNLPGDGQHGFAALLLAVDHINRSDPHVKFLVSKSSLTWVFEEVKISPVGLYSAVKRCS